MQYKTFKQFIKKLDKETRTVTGIFAVHGNVDSWNDMSVNGAFQKRLDEGRDRVRFLWNHNSMNPPIASIKSIREVEKNELPAKVLEWAPDATGGVEVTRKYYDGIPLADWVFKSIEEGDVTEMSYAFDIHEFSVKKLDDGKEIRVLQDLELFDVSDVNWGMNPATAGVKGLPVSGMTFAQHSLMVVSTVEEFVTRVKDRKNFREQEGRTLTASTREQLGKMVTEIETILKATEPMAKQEDVLAELNKFVSIESKLIGALK